MRNTEHRTAWLEALEADNVLSTEQCARLGQLDGDGTHPLEWLTAQQLYPAGSFPVLQEENLMGWLSRRSGLPVIRIDPLQLDLKSVAGTIPMRFARHHEILALRVSDEEAVIACSDPFRIDQWHNELGIALNRRLKVQLAHPKDMQIHLNALYPLHHSISRVAASNRDSVNLELPAFIKLDDMDKGESAATLTNRLLRYALERGSSDIHIEPRETLTRVRLRIDGLLHHLIYLPHSVAQVLNHRLKVLAHMDTTEKRRPQDGHLRTLQAEDEQPLELRLSTLPTAYGEKLVLRLLDPKMLRQDWVLLGMDEQTRQFWKLLLEQRNGLVLVTGPTGSGKTTTLYNALYQLDSNHCNICTVEDPIEMLEPHFNQTQVRPELDLDFATGIRAMLRQDPDVIMVGEIRDQASATAAVQAALTGHQVFSSMHTHDSAAAITRLSDIGVPDYLIRATLAGVLNQRLLPRLCAACKQEHQGGEKSWKALFGNDTAAPRLYTARGCAHCRHTGVDGRVGAFEVLFIDENLRSCIDSKQAQKFARACRQSGQWHPLYNSVMAQLRAGTIGVEAAGRVIGQQTMGADNAARPARVRDEQ